MTMNIMSPSANSTMETTWKTDKNSSNSNTSSSNNNTNSSTNSNSNSTTTTTTEQTEFLPICDALFNLISLTAYFCDIIFDLLTAYTYMTTDHYYFSILSFTFIFISLTISQVLSFRWTTRSLAHIPIHLLFSGVLWRYFKLFIPVHMATVKCEVRDLCLLRLIHAFCEASPMLLIQSYIILTTNITNLSIVSTSLSLFSVCWALASYSKNIRRQNVHKLVLTWLGVIFQFLWRLGTITSRVISLSYYATVYSYYLFVVLFLHWMTMLLWLISPKQTFNGEKMGRIKKLGYSSVIAVVYIFCYINVGSRKKLTLYYITMFLENCLLLSVSVNSMKPIWFSIGSFTIGIFFMCVYYKFFHVNRFRTSVKLVPNYRVESNGVFNCRFNPAIKRKKKMPSTFVHEGVLKGDIQQKLEKKKMQQLADLIQIEKGPRDVFFGEEFNTPIPVGGKLRPFCNVQGSDRPPIAVPELILDPNYLWGWGETPKRRVFDSFENNSSDGDVDSAVDEERNIDPFHPHPYHVGRRVTTRKHARVHHETKL